MGLNSLSRQTDENIIYCNRRQIHFTRFVKTCDKNDRKRVFNFCKIMRLKKLDVPEKIRISVVICWLFELVQVGPVLYLFPKIRKGYE